MRKTPQNCKEQCRGAQPPRALALFSFSSLRQPSEGLLDWSFSVAGAAGTPGPPAGVLLCYSAYQALKWPSSLGPFSVLSCRCREIPGERKAAVMASLTQHYRLASTAAGLLPTVISPRVSPGHLPCSQGAGSSQPPCAPGDLRPCPGYEGLRQGLSMWFSTPFRQSQISCGTLQQPQMLALCPKQLPRCGAS